MLPILFAIPAPIKQLVADTLVDFLVKQAEKFAGEKMSDSIRRLSSKADFQHSIDKALRKGSERFVAEYAQQDEDLVEAIRGLPDLWQTKSVQRELVALIKQPGAWLVEERNTIVAHFEDVLPQRINRERVDRAVTYFLRSVAEELWLTPGAKEIRDVYALQFQKITAQAAHEQAALARQQLQATVQLSADVREALAQLTTELEKHLLAAPVIAALPAPRPFHNLPRPDYSRFVGREEQLAWLRQRLSSGDRAWQIALTGIGGVGKSALALAMAHAFRQDHDHLPPAERFEAIIWISAKEEMLTAQGREKAGLSEQVLRTLEDVYTVIARVLGHEDITRAPVEEQNHLVEKALKEQRTLLIMDNLESVKDDRLKPFLRNLPFPTKALITSREWLDVADVLALTGLSDTEADLLITEESAVRQVLLNPAQRSRLVKLTSGLPLPIRLSVARLAGGENFEAVTRWLGDATGDLPEYCIAGQALLARQRDPNAWQLLLACSLFDRSAGASREALGHITNLSLADRDSGLAQLQRLFLVNHTQADRFWVLPIVQRYARVALKSVDSAHLLIARWTTWLIDFVQEYHADIDLEIEPRAEFDIEYLNVLNAISWCHDEAHWDALFKLTENTWGHAFFNSLFNDLELILDAGLDAAQNIGNELMIGKVELQLGRLAWMQSRYQRSKNEHILKAHELYKQSADKVDDPETLGILISLYIYHGELDAKPLAERLLRLGEQTRSVQLQYAGAYRLAEIAIINQDSVQALVWLEKAEAWARQLRGNRNTAAVLSRRADIFRKQNRLEEAEHLLWQTLELDIARGEKRRIAYDKNRLAKIYLQTGRIQLARQMAQEASELFDDLGMSADREAANALVNDS